MDALVPPPNTGSVQLPNGCTLYWYPDGNLGRRYVSDEVGGGVDVWVPALVDPTTLLAALTQEAAFTRLEAEIKRRSQA